MTDNTIRVRADIENDDPDAINVDDRDHDDQDVVVPAPPAAPAAGQTTLAFKVEQSIIPEYFGQKGRQHYGDRIHQKDRGFGPHKPLDRRNNVCKCGQ